MFSRWGVVHLRDPYFTIWPGEGGVADRLGVAYRRHADVRRSANDWSIATRRSSLRNASRPFFPSASSSPLARAQFTRVDVRACVCMCVCVCMCMGGWMRASVCRSSNNPTRTVGFNPPGETLLAVVAYRPSSSLTDPRGWIFLHHLLLVSKKWRITLRVREGEMAWVKKYIVKYYI